MIDDVSKTASTLIDDLLVLECLFQMNLRFGSKRMIRWHDDYKILFGNRDKFNQWFIIDFGTEADIIFLFCFPRFSSRKRRRIRGTKSLPRVLRKAISMCPSPFPASCKLPTEASSFRF